MEEMNGKIEQQQEEVKVENDCDVTKKEVEAMEKLQTVNVVELFSKTEYAIGNAVKLMNGKYGGGFYVNYLQDTGSKTGHLQLIIRYPDEQIKRVYLAKNCFQVLESECDGLGKMNIKEKEIVPQLRESLNMGDFRVLEKYETPNMPIPARVLWKIIVDNYEKIPVVPIYQTEDFEGMYWQLYAIACPEEESYKNADKETAISFFVTKEEMEKVAIENGWTFLQLRTELNLRGLLIKDKPYMRNGKIQVNSYQLTKKINGHNQRFYAIRKLVDIPKVKEDEVCLMDFTEQIYETEIEKNLREEKEANELLKGCLREKEKQIHDIYKNRVSDLTADEFREHLL